MKKDWFSEETSKLILFCRGYDEIRIYGKGIYGILLFDQLTREGQEISGFVVSDDNYHEKGEDTIVISELAERISAGVNVGIIIATSDKHYLSIFENLRQKHIDQDRCFLLPGNMKSRLWDDKREKERKQNERGVARSIHAYNDFFESVQKCNMPGKLNLVCHQHLGDTCILLGLKDEIEKHYEKEINYILKDSQECIAHLYGIDNYKTVNFDEMFDNASTRGFTEEELESFRSDIREKMFSTFPQTYVPFVTAPFLWNKRWNPEWETVVNSRAQMLGLNTKKINPPRNMIKPSDSLLESIEGEGGWEKVVLVAPEARANPQISLEYWGKIVSKLKKEGFTIICNAMRKENLLEGTIDLDLSVSDLIALGQRCHSIYSTRSGLCDCLAARGSALHVYYTNDLDRELEYYSLNNNFYLDDPVTEVMLDD